MKPPPHLIQQWQLQSRNAGRKEEAVLVDVIRHKESRSIVISIVSLMFLDWLLFFDCAILTHALAEMGSKFVSPLLDTASLWLSSLELSFGRFGFQEYR